MAFYEVHSKNDLVPGPFHIPEPRAGLEPVINLKGLMLVPGVGFDLLGNRLGYGGGYYDRYVGQEQQVITVAPAYELQLQQSIPTQEHDARVRWIVTEQRLIERK
jgi:5-formyltetrahydrofolate cyclo-ligase